MIQYKTEGLVTVKCKDEICDTVAITWLKGDDKITLRSSRNSIELSKFQINQIANMLETISDDIQPNMGSLPRAG